MQNRAKVLDSHQPEKHQVLQNNQVWKHIKIKMENHLNQVWYLFQNKSFNQGENKTEKETLNKTQLRWSPSLNKVWT